MHRHHLTDRSIARRADETGAALVEFALVLFPLLLLLGGILEVGPAYRDSLRYEQASRTAARVAANLTNDAQADREALRALSSVLDESARSRIQYIVVYEVDSDGTMPEICHTASTFRCNRYLPEHLDDLDDDTRWGCTASAHDQHWCPLDRRPELHDPVDLGVYVKSSRDWATGLLPGDGVELENETIMRLDPLSR